MCTGWVDALWSHVVVSACIANTRIHAGPSYSEILIELEAQYQLR